MVDGDPTKTISDTLSVRTVWRLGVQKKQIDGFKAKRENGIFRPGG